MNFYLCCYHYQTQRHDNSRVDYIERQYTFEAIMELFQRVLDARKAFLPWTNLPSGPYYAALGNGCEFYVRVCEENYSIAMRQSNGQPVPYVPPSESTRKVDY